MPFTDDRALAQELYELMLAVGATASAIRAKPHLMSLSYIRSEAPSMPDFDRNEESVAATVREFLSEATYGLDKPLSQREHVASDNGAAARCLLAIEPGTAALPLAARRRRAAVHAGLNVRSMTKRRRVRNGEMVSHELRLMTALADELISREVQYAKPSPFARSPIDNAIQIFPDWAPRPLLDYYRAWFLADLLPPQIEIAVNCTRSRSAVEHQGRKCIKCGMSLSTCARLIDITDYIEIPDPFIQGLNQCPAREALRQLQTALPFDASDDRQFERCVTTAVDTDHMAELLGDSIFSRWDTWLRRCHCEFPTRRATQYDFRVHDRNPTCPVRAAITGLFAYRDAVQVEWGQLQTRLQAPFERFLLPTERSVLGQVGLRMR